MTQLLRNSGIDIEHERLGRDGCVSWIHIALINVGRFRQVFHQTRNPLDVLGSAQMLSEEVLDFMRNFIYVPAYIPTLSQWALAWVEWNKLIERHSSWRYQVENIDMLLEQGGHALSKKINSWGGKPVKLSSLIQQDEKIAERLVQTAKEYGYNLI